MTNSEQALRDFAEKQFPLSKELKKEVLYNQVQQAKQNECLSDLTALISEHYVAKEEVDKMVSERLREELIKYSMYASEQWCDTSDRELSEKNIDKYLNTREK